MHDHSDIELVKGVLRGNPASEEALYRRHVRRVSDSATRVLGRSTEAEDVVQEAYLRWHAADRGRVEEPRAFLLTTTTRAVATRRVPTAPPRLAPPPRPLRTIRRR